MHGSMNIKGKKWFYKIFEVLDTITDCKTNAGFMKRNKPVTNLASYIIISLVLFPSWHKLQM